MFNKVYLEKVLNTFFRILNDYKHSFNKSLINAYLNISL